MEGIELKWFGRIETYKKMVRKIQKRSKGFKLTMFILLTLLTTGPIILAASTADNFGVDDATGYPGTNVLVPVNITNVQNGPIISLIFNISYDKSVINVVDVQEGDLTSDWDSPIYNNGFDWGTRVAIVYDGIVEHGIQNGMSGSVVVLKFSVIGEAGETSPMDFSDIQLSGTDYNVGTAPAKNGTFTIETPPYTSDHSPAKNATDVPKDTNIVIHVKDNDVGVDKSSIVMTVEGIAVSPIITGNKNDYTLTYDPPSDFEYNQVVNVTIDAQDLMSPPNEMSQDSYSFTIESGSGTTSVTITAHSPTGTSVPVGITISVTFSETMNKNSAQDAFSISPSVSGLFGWDGNKMIFYPDSKLDYETAYIIIIGTTAEDLVGNNLESEYFWQFTTISKVPKEKVVISPNPYIAGKSTQDRIVFTELPKESILRIYTISGKLIEEMKHNTTNDGGSEEWDISEIVSGIYLYYIESPKGNKKGKISIIK